MPRLPAVRSWIVGAAALGVVVALAAACRGGGSDDLRRIDQRLEELAGRGPAAAAPGERRTGATRLTFAIDAEQSPGANDKLRVNIGGLEVDMMPSVLGVIVGGRTAEVVYDAQRKVFSVSYSFDKPTAEIINRMFADVPDFDGGRSFDGKLDWIHQYAQIVPP